MDLAFAWAGICPESRKLCMWEYTCHVEPTCTPSAVGSHLARPVRGCSVLVPTVTCRLQPAHTHVHPSDLFQGQELDVSSQSCSVTWRVHNGTVYSKNLPLFFHITNAVVECCALTLFSSEPCAHVQSTVTFRACIHARSGQKRPTQDIRIKLENGEQLPTADPRKELRLN